MRKIILSSLILLVFFAGSAFAQPYHKTNSSNPMKVGTATLQESGGQLTITDTTTGSKTLAELAAGGTSGSGTTTFDTDGASAESTFAGNATRIGIAGSGGITTYGTGATVYVSGGAFARTGQAASFTTGTFSETVSTPDLRPGVSPFVLSSNTVLTSGQLDGRVFIIPTATAINIQLPAAANGLGCYIVDTTAVTGPAAGVTLFGAPSGSSLYAGTGTGAVYGTTVFANSGITRTTTRVVAMPMSNGVWSWQLFSDISSWNKIN